jgi:hypothetical protein
MRNAVILFLFAIFVMAMIYTLTGTTPNSITLKPLLPLSFPLKPPPVIPVHHIQDNLTNASIQLNTG